MKKQLPIILTIIILGVLATLLILFFGRSGQKEEPAPESGSIISSGYSSDEMPSADAGGEESSQKQEWTSLYETTIID